MQVDSQQNTDPWAKSGLVMRNNLTKNHVSPGYIVLTTTRGHGVMLQWDSNNEGILGSYVTTSNSIHATVWLKLIRNGRTGLDTFSNFAVNHP